MAPTWKPEQIETLMELHQEGLHPKEIRLHLTPTRSTEAVILKLRRLGQQPNTHRIKNWTTNETHIAIQLRKEGQTYKEIARQLRRSTHAVKRRLQYIKETTPHILTPPPTDRLGVDLEVNVGDFLELPMLHFCRQYDITESMYTRLYNLVRQGQWRLV